MRTLKDLREQLFDTIEHLQENKIPIEQAKQIANTAQVIVNSTRVEIDFLKLRLEAGEKVESEFLKLGK